ncbi:type II secretion system F family protein [bacterium]
MFIKAIISIFITVILIIISKQIHIYLKDMRIRRRIGGKLDIELVLTQTLFMRSLLFSAGRFAGIIKKLKFDFIHNLKSEIERYLVVLGKPYNLMDPYTIISIQFFLAVITIVCLVSFRMNLLISFFAGIFAFFVPLIYIKQKVKLKHKNILRELPDILDLLTLMIEAGLDFASAMNRILDIEKGVLASELEYAEQEIKLGKSRIQALNDMSSRLNFLPLKSVINSITTSMKTGANIAATLKILSEQFRTESIQTAEKLAGKAPVKLLFPLVTFIFPTVFIIIFGPIVLSFLKS